MEKTIKAKISQIDYGEYSSHVLYIIAEKYHVDTYAWGYDETPGTHTEVVFYDLTLSELLQLGQSIMTEAGRLIVEREEK